jgi:hypothetical protein
MFETAKTNSDLLRKAKEAFDDSIGADRHFQVKARESFNFRNNEQWEKLELDILAEERRPALTFNVVKAHIDLIMGLNEDLRKRYTAMPVAQEDAFLCDVLNSVDYWLYQTQDWESEENNAYESALISGRGWVNIDYDIDEKRLSDIKITETSIPVHEIKFDPAARKRDLSDASYIIWDRWLSLEDFIVKYPKMRSKATLAMETGRWAKENDILLPAEDSAGQMQNDLNDESDYSDSLDVNYYDTQKNRIRTCHMEYWKHVKKWFYWNPQEREWTLIEINKKEFEAKWNQLFPGQRLIMESAIQKELWWLQFCAHQVLVHAPSPINYPGFSIVPCFMFGDPSRRSPDHFGIVEVMKDAQREINKRTSQTLNLFNQQVQPGVYAEVGAFVNTDQAEQSMKEAGSITYLQDGALSQNKFMERTVPTFPNAVMQMSEYAREMLRNMTGINPDLMGMNDKRKEAGIVVQLRQQQGMSILKPVFKAYSEMRESLFKRQLAIIMSHMPSAQIKRILGEGDRYVVKGPAIQDQSTKLVADFRNVKNLQYDVFAEPETDSMTQNALEMATFMELQQAGMPVDPNVIISKTNLSSDEKIKWQKYIEQSQNAAAEAGKAEQEMETKKLEMQHEREMAKIENDYKVQMAKLQVAQETSSLKLASDAEKLKAQISRDEQTARLKLMQIMSQAALGDQNAKREMLKVLLDARHDEKKLILDTMEVVAQAGFAGDELKMNYVRDMFLATMDAKGKERDRQVELLKKSIDAMAKIDDSKRKAGTDIAKEVIKGKLAERAAAKQAQVMKGKPDAVQTK